MLVPELFSNSTQIRFEMSSLYFSFNCRLRCDDCVGNFSPAMEDRNQVGIGLSYRPASLSSLATQFQTRFLESIPCPIGGLKCLVTFGISHGEIISIEKYLWSDACFRPLTSHPWPLRLFFPQLATIVDKKQKKTSEGLLRIWSWIFLSMYYFCMYILGR